MIDKEEEPSRQKAKAREELQRLAEDKKERIEKLQAMKIRDDDVME